MFFVGVGLFVVLGGVWFVCFGFGVFVVLLFSKYKAPACTSESLSVFTISIYTYLCGLLPVSLELNLPTSIYQLVSCSMLGSQEKTVKTISAPLQAIEVNLTVIDLTRDLEDLLKKLTEI